MPKPILSIITPTLNREPLLPLLWRCLAAQTIQDFEWLVHDDSPSPSPFLTGLAASDGRVRYRHSAQRVSVGMKRNALVAEAQGGIILHMDDDDHYTSCYIEGMLTLMANSGADFVKLFGFHLFHRRTGMYAYWDMQHSFPLHHLLQSDSEDFPVGPKAWRPNEEWGYGFSYVYRRHVWEAGPFPDTNGNEDMAFAERAIALFKHAGMQDRDFLMLHVIHDGNMSMAYPQQLLPQTFGEAYFPEFVAKAE